MYILVRLIPSEPCSQRYSTGMHNQNSYKSRTRHISPFVRSTSFHLLCVILLQSAWASVDRSTLGNVESASLQGKTSNPWAIFKPGKDSHIKCWFPVIINKSESVQFFFVQVSGSTRTDAVNRTDSLMWET
jgi:hypothetical protein